MSEQELVKKDVFIIHSRSDTFDGTLAYLLQNQLWSWGLTTYEYCDWNWKVHLKKTYSRTGPHLDLIRNHIGHPLPRIRKSRDEIDMAWVEKALKFANVIIVLYQGDTEGKKKELNIVDSMNLPSVRVKLPGSKKFPHSPLIYQLEKDCYQESTIPDLAAHAKLLEAISKKAAIQQCNRKT